MSERGESQDTPENTPERIGQAASAILGVAAEEADRLVARARELAAETARSSAEASREAALDAQRLRETAEADAAAVRRAARVAGERQQELVETFRQAVEGLLGEVTKLAQDLTEALASVEDADRVLLPDGQANPIRLVRRPEEASG